MSGLRGADGVGVVVDVVDDSLLAFVRSSSLVRERRDSVNSSLVGERRDSVDGSLVGERVYCLVEAVGCCWSVGTDNNKESEETVVGRRGWATTILLG